MTKMWDYPNLKCGYEKTSRKLRKSWKQNFSILVTVKHSSCSFYRTIQVV